MKRFFPLFFLVILVGSIRGVHADTENLYVDTYTGDLANWDERNAPSPYLADDGTGFIHEEKSSSATEGYFGFADPSGTDVINSVTLYVECYGMDTNDLLNIYVDCSDGGGWVNEGTITVDQNSYDWETLSLTVRLDGWTDIQNAQIYFYYQGVGGGDDIYVMRAYLLVDYTPSTGTNYDVDVTQSISWAGVGYRLWDASRDFSQGLTLSSESSRDWILTRSFTQSFSFSSNSFEDLMEYILIQITQSVSFASDSYRTWGLSRAFTQGLSFASSVENFAQFLRNPVQSITASVGTFRSWILSRNFNMPMTFSSNALADIFKSFQIILTQGIQLSSTAFRQWTLSRTLDQNLSFSSLSERRWDLTRIFTQSLTTNTQANRILSAIRLASQNIVFSSSAERIISFTRGVSQTLVMATESLRSWTLSRTVTQGLSFLSNIFTKWTEHIPDPPDGEDFLRAVSLVLDLASGSIRTWSISRALSQGLSFTSGTMARKFIAEFFQRFTTLSLTLTSNTFARKFLGQLIQRFATLSLSISPIIAVSFKIIEQFDALLIPNLFAMIFTTGYFLVDEEKKIYFGGFAFMLWFFSAASELSGVVVNYELAFLYSAFALIMIIFILMDRAKNFGGFEDFWKS